MAHHRTTDNAAWRMGGITAGAVEDYLYSMLPARDEVLTEIEAEAAKRKIPIVGPAVGRILYQLALMINAKTVFELGSAVGYSTIWWARAVGEGGRVIYTDGDRKKADEARRYFDRAGVTKQITLKTGDALELLSEEKQQFDIIFNDVDKEDYPRVFKLVRAPPAQGRPVRHRQCFMERKSRAKQPVGGFDQGDPGIQPAALQLAGIVHDDTAHPRWSGGGDKKITLRTGNCELKTGFCTRRFSGRGTPSDDTAPD